MNTRAFFDFYYALYAKGGDDVVINTMYRKQGGVRKLFFDITKKREACEACIFTCFLENDNFKEQLLIYENEFKQSIERYKTSHWFDDDFGKEEKSHDYYARKYHEIRKRQIELILKYIEKVKNPNSTNPIGLAEASVDNRPPHYTYTNIDKTILLFNFLVEKGYLLNPSQNDFVYYMTGEGEHPTSCLRWNMSKKKFTLSIFIKKMFGDEVNFWDTAEKIFGVKGLKTLYGSWKSRGEKPHEIIDFVLKL